MAKLIGVTGATGYIGGTICYMLKQRGYEVVGIDLVQRKHLMPYIDHFFQLDYSSIPDFNNPIWEKCDVIIHCAGTSLVGPSIKSPSEYYNNNVAKTIKFLDWCVKHDKHVMFSSSASVYKTKNVPLTEDDPIEPLSPYAKTKWMIEQILQDYGRAYGLKSTIFRYFNACGALSDIHGQDPGATHIFPRLYECTETFELNGMDFDTRDGTCVRDYIHVRDIALAHIKAMEKNCTGVYNLGSEIGFSNLDIINAVNKPYKDVGRREGDSDCLIADVTYAKYMLGWVPLSTLPDIIDDLNGWYSSENYKRLKENAATGNV